LDYEGSPCAHAVDQSHGSVFSIAHTRLPGEAAESAARKDPPVLHRGGGREVVRSAQEHRAWLVEGRPAKDRRSAADPHPGPSACGLSPHPEGASTTALPSRRVLLFPLPSTQGVGGPDGRISAGHGALGQFAGNLCGLWYPNVPSGLTSQVGGGGRRSAGSAAAGTATLNGKCRPFRKL